MDAICMPACTVPVTMPLPSNNPPVPPGPIAGPAEIPDFSATATYDFPDVVVFNSTIYRANGPIPPGPFNPADWTALDGTTGSVAIVTQDGDTITFSGDGTQADPLTAEVNGDALVAWGDARIFYVDVLNGLDTNAGSLYAPFQTIAAAQVAASLGDVIFVAPGTYNENISFKGDVMLQGFGANDAAAVVLHGNFTIANGVGRVKLKDLQLEGVAVGTPTLIIDASAGSHSFDNVTIRHAAGAAQTAVRLTGNNLGFMTFEKGSIAGFFDVQDPLQVAALSLNLTNGSEPVKIRLNAAPVTLTAAHHLRLGNVLHQAGVLVIVNATTILKDGGGVSILSSCAAGAGALFIELATTMQADGSYGAFQKSGTCPYMLLGVKDDPFGAAKLGTNVFGENSLNIHGQYVPTNYFPANPSLFEHLKAIDAALPFSADGRITTFDIVASRPGPVLADQGVFYYKTREEYTLPANLGDSQFLFMGTAGQSVTLELRKNDVAFTTITMDTSSTTVTPVGITTFAIGDVLSVVATADAAFSHAALTIQGLRALDLVA